MSVRVNERKEGRLQVLNCARKYIDYTIQICKNENVFPKRSRWIMANRILNESLDMYSYIQKANSIRLDGEFKNLRLEYQIKAKANIDTLFALIDLAYNSFSIESHKIEYWANLLNETLIKLNSWIKSDKQRLTTN